MFCLYLPKVMALKTDSNHKQSYDFARVLNNSDSVIFNDSMMVYSSENIDEDCLIVETCSNGQLNGLSGSIHNNNFSQLLKKQPISENGTFVEVNDHIKDGLSVIEILHSTSTLGTLVDEPSYVDVSELKNLIESAKENESPIVISDDDDVIFVDSYKVKNSDKNDSKKKLSERQVSKIDDDKIRRNPVRTARNKSKDLSKDVLFEEDFAFLETSDEDSIQIENVMQERKTLSVEKYKEWPVNVHERPEYNAETNTIEVFDYTIRQLQKNNPLPKKSKLETVIVKKKAKKKYATGRRRNNRIVMEKKLPIDSVLAIVNQTTLLLKDFFDRSKSSESLFICTNGKVSSTDKLELLKNQVTLFAAVNDINLSNALANVFSEDISKTENS